MVTATSRAGIPRLRLILIEQSQADADGLVAHLARSGLAPEWRWVDTLPDLVEALYPAPDLILCAEGVADLGLAEVLAQLERLRIDLPVIAVSDRLDAAACVRAVQLGAVDYLLRDRPARFVPALERALERHRLEAERRAGEQRKAQIARVLDALTMQSPTAITLKAVDGTYLLANPRFEALHGLPGGSAIGRIDAELFEVEEARRMTELDARCLHDRTVLEQEERVTVAAGRRDLLTLRYPVSDDTGEVFGIAAVHLDITRQKRIERQLVEARADTRTRVETLGADVVQLRELDRLKSDLVLAFSDELRTPLTSIRGYLELLREDDVQVADDLADRCLEVIDRNSRQLLTMVEDLLLISQLKPAPQAQGSARRDVPPGSTGSGPVASG